MVEPVRYSRLEDEDRRKTLLEKLKRAFLGYHRSPNAVLQRNNVEQTNAELSRISSEGRSRLIQNRSSSIPWLKKIFSSRKRQNVQSPDDAHSQQLLPHTNEPKCKPKKITQRPVKRGFVNPSFNFCD